MYSDLLSGNRFEARGNCVSTTDKMSIKNKEKALLNLYTGIIMNLNTGSSHNISIYSYMACDIYMMAWKIQAFIPAMQEV